MNRPVLELDLLGGMKCWKHSFCQSPNGEKVRKVCQNTPDTLFSCGKVEHVLSCRFNSAHRYTFSKIQSVAFETQVIIWETPQGQMCLNNAHSLPHTGWASEWAGQWGWRCLASQNQACQPDGPAVGRCVGNWRYVWRRTAPLLVTCQWNPSQRGCGWYPEKENWGIYLSWDYFFFFLNF